MGKFDKEFPWQTSVTECDLLVSFCINHMDLPRYQRSKSMEATESANGLIVMKELFFYNAASTRHHYYDLSYLLANDLSI
jgi:hypothetical protein